MKDASSPGPRRAESARWGGDDAETLNEVEHAPDPTTRAIIARDIHALAIRRLLVSQYRMLLAEA